MLEYTPGLTQMLLWKWRCYFWKWNTSKKLQPWIVCQIMSWSQVNEVGVINVLHHLTARQQEGLGVRISHTYRSRAGVGNSSLVFHPLVIQAFLVGKGSIESSSNGCQGVNAYSWATKNAARREKGKVGHRADWQTFESYDAAGPWISIRNMKIGI